MSWFRESKKQFIKSFASRTVMERTTIEGNSPVYKSKTFLLIVFLSTTLKVKLRGNHSKPLEKAKYFI
jgi:hypothetical protein